MKNRDPAPLTARLLTRKRGTAPSGPASPRAGGMAPARQAEPVPPVRNIHPASPTVHAVDLTPPDFLRAEKRDGPAKPQTDGDEIP